MTLGDAIFNILSNDANVTALVPSTRIIAVNAPQTTANPCIIHSRASTFPTYDKEDGKIVEVQYEIDIFASTHGLAEEISDTVRTALDLYEGAFTGFRLDRIRFDGQDDRFYDADNKSYQISQGYTIKIFYD